MCGIVGSFNALMPSGRSLSHRGTVHELDAWRGDLKVRFHRLPITGGTSNPYTGKDYTVWIVGEIYNYRDLGHVLTEDSDVEAVAHEFDARGLDPTRLNGMFIILAYHHLSGAAHIIRDRFGVKQCYIRRRGVGFQFASEPKAFEQLEEDPFGVEQFEAFTNIFTGGTMFKGVDHVPAGGIFNLDNGQVTRYHSWNQISEDIRFNEASEEVAHLLAISVKRQYEHGQPKVGLLLSGGMDSGYIAQLTGCDSFTAAMEVDETELAVLQAKGRHYIQSLPLRERSHYLTEAMKYLDDPRLGASWSNYALYELASKRVTVVMDGSGADELFGGYPWRYSATDYADVLNRSGEPLSDTMKEVVADVFPKDGLRERLQFDIDNFMQGLFIVSDRLSMAHTVEARVPFCDNDLWDFVMRLPLELRHGKNLFRFNSLIHPTVRSAPKRGFTSGEYLDRTNGNKQWIKDCVQLWRINNF